MDVFEEHTRRQYRSKLPDFNPFGDDEIATKFDDLDVFTKVRITTRVQSNSEADYDRYEYCSSYHSGP